VLVLAAAATSAGRDIVGEPLPAPRPVHPELASKPHWRLTGVASCSSASCHNFDGPQGSKRSEYSTWIGHDKHAQAYSILFDERSRRIQKNLNPKLLAHENSLCLKCHVSQDYETDKLNPRFEIADGVHCENCHGAAEGWLASHFQPSWRNASDAAKEAIGFKPTKNLLVRAQSCVECHVGSPRTGADVNHDLIAAGHPRLNFELGNYLATYPRHWSLTEDKQRYPDFEARAWAIGQVVSAKQALELLAWRAEDKPDRPWPELAEYSCFACHQSLSPNVRTAKQPQRTQPLGRPAWNTWYLALTPSLAKARQANLGPAFANLGTEMTNLAADRAKVRQEAMQARDALDRLLDQVHQSPPQSINALGLLRELASADPRVAASTWDEAAQRYLALTALYQTLGDLDRSYPPRHELKAGLESLLRSLQFQPGYDSPPGGYDPAKVRPAFETIHKGLGR
jgi:hypothetical protein